MIQRYKIIISTIILAVCSMVLSVVVFSAEYQKAYELNRIVNENTAESRVNSAFLSINDFPGSAGQDMQLLRSLSSLAQVFIAEKNDWHEAVNDIQLFLDNNPAYKAFYVYGKTDTCLFSVDRDESNVCTCDSSSDSLGNAVSATKNIAEGGVYVSDLIKMRCGTKTEETPTILYATRFSNSDSDQSGTIIGIVDANYFLEQVRRLKRDGEAVYLVDNQGTYLSGPDSSKEWISGTIAGLFTDYPELNSDVLLDAGLRHLDIGNREFTFLRLAPSVSNFTLYNGSQLNQNNLWILVVVSDTNVNNTWLSLQYISIMLLLVVHLVLIGMLVSVYMLQPDDLKK